MFCLKRNCLNWGGCGKFATFLRRKEMACSIYVTSKLRQKWTIGSLKLQQKLSNYFHLKKLPYYYDLLLFSFMAYYLV